MYVFPFNDDLHLDKNRSSWVLGLIESPDLITGKAAVAPKLRTIPIGSKRNGIFYPLIYLNVGVNTIQYTLPKTNKSPWKIYHFDGIYKETMGIFMGNSLVSGRVL